MAATACRWTALAVATLLAFGCSSRTRPGTTATNPNLITEADIRAQMDAGVRDAHELIERIRPRWLQGRADRSLNLQTRILVYHNQQAIGGIEALRSFELRNIRSLRYLDAAQAGLLPGGGGQHVEGAIVISTARGP